ncbi:MAG: tRNA (N(6)-L-threonylcarbamoyladenosine(37)-C(2))-methylthiotransferase MtaB [Aquificaceae bacterium]
MPEKSDKTLKTFRVFTLGCRSNSSDSAQIASQFISEGLIPASEGKEADIYIVNTCAVTSEAERSSRQLIYKLRRENPFAKIIVTGCLSQIKPQSLLNLKEADIIVANSHREQISKIALSETSQKVFHKNIFSLSEKLSYNPVLYFERSRPFIKIQEGCNHFCSFCVIPFARGKLRSAPLDAVLNLAKEVINQGFEELVLCGTQLSQYGLDMGLNLASLLRELLKLKDLRLIRLSSMHPKEITPDLLDIMLNCETIAPHFHLPLQSGSDRILKLMRREISVIEFSSLVETILGKRPNTAIGTDIIVGFPTETEEDFKATLRVIEELPLAYIHPFSFSERPYIKASYINPKVPERIKKQRVKIIKDLGEKKRAEFELKNKNTKLRAVALSGDEILTENYIKLPGRATPGKVYEICLI